MTGDRQDRKPRPTEFLLVLLAALVFAVVLRWPLLTLDRSASAENDTLFSPPPAWLLPLDDAYIFVRYAQQAAQGHPLEWNEGELSSGATSFIFPWLLVPGQWLFDDLDGWSWWSSLIGLLSLGALGAAGLRLLRAAGAPDPWPLAAGIALVWSGPIGWVTLAGMDSALGSAALLWAAGSWIEAGRPGRVSTSGRSFGMLVLIALFPFFRPDFAVVTGLAALAITFGLGPPMARRYAGFILLPGLMLALFHFLSTGHVSPAGALVKSTFSAPYLTLPTAILLYRQTFAYGLLPVYMGQKEALLPPPVGWLAMAMALFVLSRALLRRERSQDPLFPLVILWLALVAVAPLSGFLIWQHLRHHHPGLACAWLLATAALMTLARIVGRRCLFTGSRWGRGLILALPFLLWIRFPYWSLDFFSQTVKFYQQNGKAAEWLRENPVEGVLLLHDAGLLAVAHDGPAVDVIGLGTNEFALPYRNGFGAVVETLARRAPLPRLAAVWDRLFDVPGLLGPPLYKTRQRPDLPENERLYISPFLSPRLAATVLEGEGLDLAYLNDERRFRLVWSRPPPGGRLSLARTLLTPDGGESTQGCRLLLEELRIELPERTDRVRVRAMPEPGLGGRLTVRSLDGSGKPMGTREIELPRGSPWWTEAEVTIESGTHLVLANQGRGAPCIESLRF